MTERVGAVRARVRAAGSETCVVVNSERVVLGLLRTSELDGDPVEEMLKRIELLQKEIDGGKDPDAKAFATETLPKVKAHLDKITKIAADAGVSA